MDSRSLALLVVMGVAACLATEPASMGPFFSQPATSIPQLVAQQELQRRYADVMLGIAQSTQWQQYSAAEGRKFALLQTDPSRAHGTFLEEENDDDDDVSLLELKSTFASPFAPLLQPFLGDNNNNQNNQNVNDLDLPALEKKSTIAKLTALKYLQVQLYLVTSDVEKTYWVNKILTPVLPAQLSYFKLYKQYLTTTALSLAYQLHDSFTLEGYLDNFNDDFGGVKTDLSEALAELHVYTQWYSLASIKLQLFYLSIYEQSMMGQVQRMAAGNAFQSASSFLEVNEELKAEPETPFVGSGDSASLIHQRTFLTQYVSMLRLYVMYSELGLASTGLRASQLKHQALLNKYDGKADNDVDGHKQARDALEIEAKQLTPLFGQWSQLTGTKYQLEFALLFMDMQSPQIALMTAPIRADNAVQDLNLMQNEATTTPAAPSN